MNSAVAVVLLVARVTLSAVLVVAALAKLADRPGTRRAAVEFGLPPWLAAPVAAVLPPIELALAVALLVPGTARLAAVGVFVLLTAFTLAMIWNLGKGRTPDCHCFGAHVSPIGWATVARNAVLAAAAALVAGWGPGARFSPSIPAGVRPAEVVALVAVTLVFVLLVVHAGFSLALLREHGRLLLRLEQLEAAAGSARRTTHEDAAGRPGIGDRAPRVDLQAISGEPVSRVGGQGQETLVVFWNPDCRFCRPLLPQLKAWEAEPVGRRPALLIVSAGSVEDNAAMGLSSTIVLDDAFATGRAFGATGTPSAVLVDEQGRIACDVAVGADAVLDLLRAGSPAHGRT